MAKSNKKTSLAMEIEKAYGWGYCKHGIIERFCDRCHNWLVCDICSQYRGFPKNFIWQKHAEARWQKSKKWK